MTSADTRIALEPEDIAWNASLVNLDGKSEAAGTFRPATVRPTAQELASPINETCVTLLGSHDSHELS